MIRMTAVNFKITDGIDNYVNKRLDKLHKYLDKKEIIDVLMKTGNYGNKIEVSLYHNKKNLRASSVEDDMYVAIDLVVDKIEKQLKKEMEIKLKNRKNYVDTTGFNQSLKIDDKPKIVKRKVVSSKPMFEQEAIEQMELLDHRSFIFFNENIGSICMLYKRHDGDYGIIETA